MGVFDRYRQKHIAGIEAAWKDLEFDDVDRELLELTEKHIAREQASSDTLSTRLTATITLASALLALGVTLAGTAAKIHVGDDARTWLSRLLVAAIVLLVAAIASALAEIRPRMRFVPNPELLRHYATQKTDEAEIRADTFKLYGVALEELARRNVKAGRAARRGLLLVALALTVAAGAALIIYFDTPWPKARTSSSQPHPLPPASLPHHHRRNQRTSLTCGTKRSAKVTTRPIPQGPTTTRTRPRCR